ncbi:hypothetical protein CA54_17450 [Symmachiella macrocystis]|uniref:Uncharacterized protein n=1 Tax=Symmachiella macrocystis TaxID=2527985 RepID=A0A5C6BPI2_9PLAN|nr:hypothetical protein [Symmachiella macrocystis]TWU12919.1 hypothetical protein CA54_17450 [Symmachiella macrocystis]
MTNANALNNEEHLESPLREAVEAVRAEQVPDEVLQRAIVRALDIPSVSVAPPERSRHRGRWVPRRWLGFAVGTAAVVMVAFIWHLGNRSVLADVVKAVSNKTWLHAQGQGPNGVAIEMWYSPKHRIIAMRQGRKEVAETLFANVGQDTIEFYKKDGAGNPLLSRLPIDKDQRKQFSSGESTLNSLFFGRPLQGAAAEELEITGHTEQTIHDGDDIFIEHRFTTRVAENKQPTETVLRVDPETELPVAWESKIGKTRVFSCRVDFPATGPQTIYALGIPRDVEVLDQTPSPDQERILAALKTGRTEFDSYRAVVVESNSADHHANGSLVYQVWRQGLKWRVEQLRQPVRLGQGPHADEVPEGEEPRSWWLERGYEWEKMPESVSDGTQEIRLEKIKVQPRQPDPSNPRYILIVSYKPVATNTFRPRTTDPRPRDYRIMPEFHAYPFLFGAGIWGFQINVDAHPTEGPPRTVLVDSRKKSPSKLPGRIRGARYWVDPSRGYVVQQTQWLKTGQADQSRGGRVEMEELAVSPSGLWYPRVVRELQNSVNLDDGTTNDTFLRFYVDFEAEIPDELFDVNNWGPIE